MLDDGVEILGHSMERVAAFLDRVGTRIEVGIEERNELIADVVGGNGIDILQKSFPQPAAIFGWVRHRKFIVLLLGVLRRLIESVALPKGIEVLCHVLQCNAPGGSLVNIPAAPPTMRIKHLQCDG